MNLKPIRLLAWGLAVLAAAVPAAAADKAGLTFRLETRAGGAGVETRDTSRIYWFDGRWKEEAETAAVIIDLRDDRLVLMDREGQTWCGGPVDAMLAEMEREITRLAARVRDTYGPQPEPPVSAAPAPPARLEEVGRERVGGRPARHFKLWLGDSLEGEYWLDEAIRPGDYFPAERLRQVVARFHAVTAIFERELRSAAHNAREQAIQEALGTLFLQGLELQSVDYRAGRTMSGKKVTEVSEWAGDAAAFQVPADYRRISYREFLDASLPSGKEVLENSR
ncbi:MAG TPA: hypothetical protein PLY66_12665 [Acidobacteriota bacterium]|nr:hypothetical protein [Acidobacteriota bacterium]HQF87620.1 hypothetical protein [Acidobacteriota bacterium]HQG92625.1 hypothetical protein [Acidobacteriota bacterium]